MSKHTKQRCLCLAAYQCKTCFWHGARRPENIVRGEKHHWYKGRGESREVQKNRPALNKEIERLGALLLSGKPITNLSADPKQEKLQAEQARLESLLHPNAPAEPKPHPKRTRKSRAKPKTEAAKLQAEFDELLRQLEIKRTRLARKGKLKP